MSKNKLLLSKRVLIWHFLRVYSTSPDQHLLIGRIFIDSLFLLNNEGAKCYFFRNYLKEYHDGILGAQCSTEPMLQHYLGRAMYLFTGLIAVNKDQNSVGVCAYTE